MLNAKNDEQMVSALRELYESRGYSQFKMIKFEEYDLYVRNKDFLTSENVITFNDMGGKLMALKPDVTLSIIKNSPDKPDELSRLYYNENVYRVSKGTHNFKEIMQVGLECMGDVDSFIISEVITLAAKSLMLISGECLLSISDLAVTGSAINRATEDESVRRELLSCIGEKNRHSLLAICSREGIDSDSAELLSALTTLHGRPDEVFSFLDKAMPGSEEVARLKKTILSLDSDVSEKIEIDFSFIDNLKYYNGIVFKGYINGIPNSVISGGQYDRLMKKMGKESKAIGFAVYLDEIERLYVDGKKYDADTVILYSKGCDTAALNRKISGITAEGKSVAVFKKIPEKFRYRECIDLTDTEGC